MNPIMKKAMRAGNAIAVSLYRRTNGRIGGTARGTPVLLLTVAGRKSGTPHTVPISYFEYDGGYLVTGSAGGMKDDPQWIRNLKAAGWAHIQIGSKALEVDAYIPNGSEREELWREVVLARAPFFAKYQEKSGRLISVAMLVPRLV